MIRRRTIVVIGFLLLASGLVYAGHAFSQNSFSSIVHQETKTGFETQSASAISEDSTWLPQTFEEWRSFLLEWKNMTYTDIQQADPITIETLDKQASVYQGWANGTYTDEEKSQLLSEIHMTPIIGPVLTWSTTDVSFSCDFSIENLVFGEHIFRVYAYVDYDKSDTNTEGGDTFIDGSDMKGPYGPYGYLDPYPYETLPYIPELDQDWNFLGSDWDLGVGVWGQQPLPLVVYHASCTGVPPGEHYLAVQVLWRYDELLLWPPFTYNARYRYTTVFFSISTTDDDSTPPVIPESSMVNPWFEPFKCPSLIIDSMDQIPIEVCAYDDDSGIDNMITFNGVNYESEYDHSELIGWDPYTLEDIYSYWYSASVNSPRTPGDHTVEVKVWDADKDRPGDQLSTSYMCNFFIYDDDTSPPVIQEIFSEPIYDSEDYLQIRIQAADSSGIDRWIAFNGIKYYADYINGYYWIEVPSPKTPGLNCAEIEIWDNDNDRGGDQLSTTQSFYFEIIDDDSDPPVVILWVGNLQMSGDQIQFTIDIDATDSSGIGTVLVQIDGYTFTDLNPHIAVLYPGIYTATVYVEDNDNDRPEDRESVLLDVQIILDLQAPETGLLMEPYYTDGFLYYVTSGTLFTLDRSDDVSGIAATYYRIDEGEWIVYTDGFKIDGPDGTYSISYFSTDNVGNTEDTHTTTVQLVSLKSESYVTDGDGNELSSFRIVMSKTKSGEYRLVATNPGQFFYHVELENAWPLAVDALNVLLDIPSDFAFQGTNPIHVFLDDIEITEHCIITDNNVYVENFDSGSRLHIIAHLTYALRGNLYETLSDFIIKSYTFTSEISGLSGSLSVPGSSLAGSYYTSIGLVGNLKKTTAIAGYVRDANGLPVPGVTVKLLDELGQVLLETTTDEQGFYYFINIEAGIYQVEVIVEGIAFSSIVEAIKGIVVEAHFQV
ncbi:MAG: OmpL47-type beta-barrel domain-containing protein [Candidatus Thorarchaeota archaeon]